MAPAARGAAVVVADVVASEAAVKSNDWAWLQSNALDLTKWTSLSTAIATDWGSERQRQCKRGVVSMVVVAVVVDANTLSKIAVIA